MSGRLPQDFADKFERLVRDVEALKRRGGTANATITDDVLGKVRAPQSRPGLGAPTAPVTVAPKLSITGSKEGMTIVAEGTVAPSSMLDYYLDGVLVISTRQTVLFWTTDATGAPMKNDTPYTWTVFARNELGGVSSDPVMAMLDPGVESKTVLGWVAAGFLLAGTIQVGSNILISPDDGIAIDLADGGIIHFPANGSDAVITARLRTSELDVDGTARFSGRAVIEGVMEVPAGIAPPISAPAVVSDWTDLQTLVPFDPGAGNWSGLADAGTSWLSATWSVDEPGAVWSIDKADTSIRTKVMDLSPGRVYGIGITASFIYVLSHYQNSYVVKRHTRAGVYQSGTIVANGVSALPGTPHMAVTPTGTLAFTLVFPHTAASSDRGLFINVHAGTGTMARTHTYRLDAAWVSAAAPRKDVDALVVTAADFGVVRAVVVAAGAARVYTFGGADGTSLARVAANDWALPETTLGIAWDGTRFVGLSATLLRRFSRVLVATNRVVASTLVDSNPLGLGTHQTNLGKSTTYSQAPRSWFRVAIPGLPEAPGIDEPDSGAVYVANRLQAQLPPGQVSLVLEVPTTTGAYRDAASPNEFDSVPGMTGELRSAGGTFSVLGNAGRAGHIAWNADGSDANDLGDQDVRAGVTGTAPWAASRVTQADVRRKLGSWQLWFMTSASTDLSFPSSNYNNQLIGTLPVSVRPRRRVPWSGRWYDSSVTGVVEPDGRILIVGGIARSYNAGYAVEFTATCIE